ncbi:MAG: DUF962 domain-containing protein [Calothrix sp. SM1_7_51]|nr:DUF962 domain-containing protein [Calothrix sp. SM1_7_51]
MKVSKQQQRNRINSEIIDHPFTDYWDIFILKHQHPVNIACHVLGLIIFYGLLALVWELNNPWLALGLPLSQIVGLAGHYFFERSHIDLQDAIFSWRASWCLGKLLWRLLIGKYSDDIQQRKEILKQYQLSFKASLIQRNRVC